MWSCSAGVTDSASEGCRGELRTRSLSYAGIDLVYIGSRYRTPPSILAEEAAAILSKGAERIF